MGLENKLKTTGSPYSINNGKKPSIPDFKNSTLHNTYSINGIPVIQRLVDLKKLPSELDLNGEEPEKYSDIMKEIIERDKPKLKRK